MVADALREPLELDLRDMAPPQGLREVWYPAILARKVGRKPVKLTMLGQELFLFGASCYNG